MRSFPIIFLFIIISAASFSNANAANAATIETIQPEGPTPWTHLKIKKSSSDFSFVIVGDNTNIGRTDVFEKTVDKINILNPDFTMCVGDLIQGYTSSEGAINWQWNEIERITAKLKAPFFYTVGNHDIWNDVSAKVWKERFGSSYYYFRYKDVLFISLNSENIQTFVGSKYGIEGEEGLNREMMWIKKVLKENSNARWTFLFLHQPFWDSKQIPPPWIQIEKMLGDRPYTIFAGHYHSYTAEKRNGRDYITLSTTGGDSALRGIDYGEVDHITLVNMTKEGPLIANLLFDGIYDKNMRTKTVRELVNAVEGAVSVESEISQDLIFKKGTARFKIANAADRFIKIKAAFSGSDNVKVKKEIESAIVGAGETRIIELPIEGSDSCFYGALNPAQAIFNISVRKPDGQDFNVENKYEVYPETLYPCTSNKDMIHVDGDLTEWGDLPYSSRLGVIADNKKNVNPPLQFAVGHDSRYLYIAGKVIDDELFFSRALGHTEQDGLAISLDPRPDPKRSANVSIISEWHSGENVKMLNISVGLVEENRKRTEIIPGFPEGTLIGRRKIEGGYAIEIAIPVSFLEKIQGRSWKIFRLNVGVRDKDPSKGNNITVKWWRPDRFGDRAVKASGTFIRQNSH